MKVISPFLLDSRDAGGLGLTTSQVGLVYGTFGILALTCGGLLGGFAAAKYGLKRMLPIMVGSMYLPKLAFVFLSWTQPSNFLITCAAVATEQFGYGFGFTAFMLYMLFFADGPHKTAHFAICTGFMALGMMVPGMWSGWVADLVGYKHFFVWVICSAIPGFTLALLLNRKIDPGIRQEGNPLTRQETPRNTRKTRKPAQKRLLYCSSGRSRSVEILRPRNSPSRFPFVYFVYFVVSFPRLLHEQRQRRRVAVQEALLAHRPDLAVAEEPRQPHRPQPLLHHLRVVVRAAK